MWSRPHAFCTLHDCQCLRGIQKKRFDIDYVASKTRLVRAFLHSHNSWQFHIEISLKIAMQISWLFVQLQKLFTSVAFTCLGHPVPSEGEPVDRGSSRVEMGWPSVGTETRSPRCSNTFQHNLRCTRRLSSFIHLYSGVPEEVTKLWGFDFRTGRTHQKRN